MHEQALFEDLRRELDRLLEREGRPKVLRVRLWVGALSHLTEEALRTEWKDHFASGPLSGASLEVRCSHDLDDPRARSVVLESLDVDSDPSSAFRPDPPRALTRGQAARPE